MTRDQISAFFRRLAEQNPAPATELAYTDPYTLLVAVVLSAQATDVSVNRATKPLFAVADTPAKMLALGEERLAEAIKTIGLYRTKAKNVIALSRLLLERHGGQVPGERAALDRRVPAAFKPHAHHWLILHGRYVCTARRPRCPDCVLRDLCGYRDKTAGPVVRS